ncbi:MAG: hypothetical protein ACXVCP_18525 [Bdellovibrio sp.]
MKTLISFFFTILFASNTFAQSSTELSCRAQAKELAMQTYSSCMTQARNHQVEDIRKNYQKELSALKNKYDHKIKQIGGSKLDKTAAKDLKGLPPKIKTETLQLPVANKEVQDKPVNQEKSVSSSNEEVSDTSAAAPSQEEPVEVIEMPVE